MKTWIYWQHLCVTYTPRANWELLEEWLGLDFTLTLTRYPYMYCRLFGLQISVWR